MSLLEGSVCWLYIKRSSLRVFAEPKLTSSSVAAFSLTSRPNPPAFDSRARSIDVNNSFAVAQALRGALHDQPCIHVDLGSVSFRDPDGIRMVIRAARTLSAGRGIFLHGLPAPLVRVMRATGWIQLPGLAICNCGQPLEGANHADSQRRVRLEADSCE